jgi:hypothetical protein
MNGELAASGNVRRPMKSGLTTGSARESRIGTKRSDDPNTAETSIEITACYQRVWQQAHF